MQAPIGEFNFTRLERVIFGPGKIDALAGEMERRSLARVIVVTGKTLGGSPLLEKVTKALGSRCAALFKGVRQHVPVSSVKELEAEIDRTNADCVISFGGGSPIDTAKAAAHAFLDKREIVHIAIPTTLSAGEYTFAAGVTDESTRVKGAVRDPRLQPRTVLNDPAITLGTPDWLWVATGMRALDHAIESAYSVRHQPISDALASKAIALLVAHLKPSIQTRGDEQLAHRGHCQMAAWFSIFGATNTGFGLSHMLGHQIGPRWDVPHGITSCITLPHAMRVVAGIAPDRFGPIADGYGIPFDAANPKEAALKCADRTAEFIAGFDVPRSLQAAGVPRAEVEEIVETVLQEVDHAKVVDRPLSREEVAGLLRAAY